MWVVRTGIRPALSMDTRRLASATASVETCRPMPNRLECLCTSMTHLCVTEDGGVRGNHGNLTHRHRDQGEVCVG